MNTKKPIVSFCIPTNGVSEWVIPVLDSIFKQNVDESLFEVVIGDNGNNNKFKNDINIYLEKYSNIHYFKIISELFLSEIETYSKAQGLFIKFVNHRSVLIDGTVHRFIQFAKDNQNERPIVYFSNGVLEGVGDINEYNSFNDFVRRLSYFSSWSSGMAIWKDDLDYLLLNNDYKEFNELFPHTTILFGFRDRKKYIVDNNVFFNEIDSGEKPKGKYDVFYAFGIEYPNIIYNLYKDNSISKETFEFVKYRNLGFIGRLYINYIVLRQYTSYDLSGFNNIFGKYYTKLELYRAIIRKSFWKANKEIRKNLGLKI